MNKKDMLKRIEKTNTAREERSFARPLTKRQQEILDFIRLHAKQYGFPPTRKEICTAFGFTSPNAAQQHIDLMAKKGVLRTQHGARAILLLEPA